MRRVSYLFPVAFHYRQPFNDRLREILIRHEVEYNVVYSNPPEENIARRDTVDFEWGKKVPIKNLPLGLDYQMGLLEAWRSDLVIIQQENLRGLNYILNIASILGLKKVAFFGHGRNFQARNPNSFAEAWKRFWATKVDWWFAYTEQSRAHLESIGFSSDRITVFNNSVDTSLLREQVAKTTPERLATVRTELGLTGHHVGVFVGGIYPDKRMQFLVAAADKIRSVVPDFEMIVIGGGSDLPLISKLAETRPWIHVTGPRFGTEKAELMMLGHVFLMPGLMGLAILDAAVIGLPIATTAFPWHSPEIAYLEPGVSGLIVQDWEDANAYGDAVGALLLDPIKRERMSREVKSMSERFSIEAMADRFSAGVLKALSS